LAVRLHAEINSRLDATLFYCRVEYRAESIE
jgi:hypothetical protein